MSEKLGEKPAFPTDRVINRGVYENASQGISKRFYAACCAMQGILASEVMMTMALRGAKGINVKEEIVVIKSAYEYADELLKQEKGDSCVQKNK